MERSVQPDCLDTLDRVEPPFRYGLGKRARPHGRNQHREKLEENGPIRADAIPVHCEFHALVALIIGQAGPLEEIIAKLLVLLKRKERGDLNGGHRLDLKGGSPLRDQGSPGVGIGLQDQAGHAQSLSPLPQAGGLGAV